MSSMNLKLFKSALNWNTEYTQQESNVTALENPADIKEDEHEEEEEEEEEEDVEDGKYNQFKKCSQFGPAV